MALIDALAGVQGEQHPRRPRVREELLHNVFDFADREVRDIMVPALDVAWLDARMSPDAALDRITDEPPSRYPVGDGEIDQLTGVVHVRDLITGARRLGAATVGELARPALVVPESKDLGALLRQAREEHQTQAVVVDEHGAVAGIATLEDLLEEIVGEIEDEFDLPDAWLERLEDGSVRVAGSMSVDDVNEATGSALPQDGPRTLAGLAFDALGRRPVVGDEIELGGVRIRVEEIDALPITRLRISPGPR